ncbi:MAG: transposase, partial [Bacilli bacterium]|nr:transposase [Bacilli bacterium]
VFGLCKVSKDLYNQALFLVKDTLNKEDRFLFYNELEPIMKELPNLDNEVNYRKLKAQVAQQTLKSLDKNVIAYIKAIKDWSKHKEKYNGMPKFPKFMPKNGYRQLIYTNQSCSIKNGHINLSKTLKIVIPQWDKYKDKLSTFQQVRINPKKDNCYEVEIIYLINDCQFIDNNAVASIDLGVDNLVTIVSSEFKPLLYSGKQVKTMNQYFNKTIAYLKSALEKCNKKKSSKRINELCEKRDRQIEDVFHKISRDIVNRCIAHKVSTIIVGYNSGWKDSINIGRRNNQTFVMIPYDKLIRYLEYKCMMSGIRVVIQEESYTSKCDSLSLEEICKHEEYLGKRIKRGLYQSSQGKLINADVNGAMN